MVRTEQNRYLHPEGGMGGGGTPIFTPGSSGINKTPADPIKAEEEAKPKIRAFRQALASGHHDKEWLRPTNKTGEGATHVKSFHCKLAEESLAYLDEQVNEWLDTHPDYEVKLVTTCVGEWTGKVKEPHMIVQVWV